MILISVIVALLIGFIPNAKPTTILHPASFGGDSQSVTDELSWRGCFWIDMRNMDLSFSLSDSDVKRFWNFVEKSKKQNGCWIWTGSKIVGKSKLPYGQFSLNGIRKMAHRISYFLQYGKIPKKKPLACHNCPCGDNPSCVNPNHLWAGTHLDNNVDTVLKCRNRPSRGNNHYSKWKPEVMSRGENHYRTGLKQFQVDNIRILYIAYDKNFGGKALAQKYNVSVQVISDIVNWKKWKGVA